MRIHPSFLSRCKLRLRRHRRCGRHHAVLETRIKKHHSQGRLMRNLSTDKVYDIRRDINSCPNLSMSNFRNQYKPPRISIATINSLVRSHQKRHPGVVLHEDKMLSTSILIILSLAVYQAQVSAEPIPAMAMVGIDPSVSFRLSVSATNSGAEACRLGATKYQQGVRRRRNWRRFDSDMYGRVSHLRRWVPGHIRKHLQQRLHSASSHFLG